MVPPELVRSTAWARSRVWSADKTTTSPGAFRQGISGWRRIVPVDVQGASINTASKVAAGGSGVQSSALAITVKARKPVLERFSCSRAIRDADRSTAHTVAPQAANCAVLPPGAAHKSATERPHASPAYRGSRILTPPFSLGISGQCRDLPMRGQPDRVCQQFATTQSLRPSVRIGLDRDIERWLQTMGKRNGPRSILAIGL